MSAAPGLAEVPSAEPAEPPPVPGSPLIRDRLHAPLRQQATGNDARAERLFRKVRGEMDELRSTLDAIHAVSDELTELDLAAVAEHPEAAAQLPPAVLVRGLVAAHETRQRLERKVRKARARNERLARKVRQLRQERSYVRGRMLTFEEVIAALHANIEDLRIARDGREKGEAAVAPPPAPRVLRPGVGPDAISPADEA